MINRFDGKYFFLSNFYPTVLTFDGLTYRNSESAYQAQKTLDIYTRLKFTDMSPGKSKRAGRDIILRPDWDKVKVDIMYRVLMSKFTQNPELRDRLLDTGNEHLIEGNNWGDKVWGQVDGEGQNYLGKCLMRVRDELRYKRDTEFDASATKERVVQWIRDYMAYNASDKTNIVIGISGGKDSTIAATLAVEAVGKDRVIGVLIPQGDQSDINDSKRVVEHLGIRHVEINIGDTVNTLFSSFPNSVTFTDQAKINTPARIRMTTLYAVAACVGCRVLNTCNLSEDFVGYSTKFGDSAGDFAPLANLTVTEIRQIGMCLDIPKDLVLKTPSDGLCGKSDEDNLGFTYEQLDTFIRQGREAVADENIVNKIEQMHIYNLHKLCILPSFQG